MAVIFMGLIATAIYSLSQMNSGVWTSSLTEPVLHPNQNQDLPAVEYSNEGKTLRSQTFEGRWTLLTFWAYWCAPCLEEMPGLNALIQNWQGPEFNIITINIDPPNSETFESARQYLTENAIVIPTIFDKTGELKKAFKVESLPQHFLISPDKKIVWQAKGAFKWNEAAARDQLLKLMETTGTEQPDPASSPDSEE